MFIDEVRNTIKYYHMLKAGDRVAIGVSGGCDSVCLLTVLIRLAKELSFDVCVVHINHCIRGADADKDEDFVRKMSEKKGVPFYSYRYDVPGIAATQKLTLEEAGRMVRRLAFQKCMEEAGCNKLALAHQAEDVSETLIINLARGSGITGLCSMRPVRDFIIRPLIRMSRADIETYLQSEGISFHTDSTNACDDYTRNKIRHHVLPYLENEINSAAVTHIDDTAEDLRQLTELFEKETENLWRSCAREDQDGILLEEKPYMSALPILQNELIRKAIGCLAGTRKDITRAHINAISALAKGQTGKYLNLPYEIICERTYGGLHFTHKENESTHMAEVVRLAVPGVTKTEKYRITCEIQDSAPSPIPEKRYTKWLDYDKIKNILTIRGRRRGDMLSVTAAGGRKSLSDYLINEKVQRDKRDTLLLLADGSDILWVIGMRIGERYKVTDSTKHVLKIRIEVSDDEE